MVADHLHRQRPHLTAYPMASAHSRPRQACPGCACSRADPSHTRAAPSTWAKTQSESRWSLNLVALALNISAISGRTNATPSAVAVPTSLSGPGDGGMPPEHPATRGALLQREPEHCRVGGELVGTGRATGAAASPHLMERRLDSAPVAGRQRRPRRGQPQLPPAEVFEQRRLGGGEDRDLQVGVGPRLCPRNRSSAHPSAPPGPTKIAITSTARRLALVRVSAPWAANPPASSCGWNRPSGPGW